MLVSGVPVITGALLGVGLTLILNAVRVAESVPSLTERVMLLNVPAAVGVPVRAPVFVLKLAQAGLLTMLNVRLSPSMSLAEGVKL